MSDFVFRLMCRMGLHSWIYTKRTQWVDDPEKGGFHCSCRKRHCMVCGRRQRLNEKGIWENR